jgi:hypothetical protein
MDEKATKQWQESGFTKACFDPSPRTNSALVNGEGSPTLREDRSGKSYHLELERLTDPNGGDSGLLGQLMKGEFHRYCSRCKLFDISVDS